MIIHIPGRYVVYVKQFLQGFLAGCAVIGLALIILWLCGMIP